ncbi:MAG: hypothetical protein CVU84_04355 [Firmicutes bacterium HGW-Firmicutes-1]|jgi:hypothetical protein|nr:MAG: hypothetical protein CVU84_04355 [Firmicutes bacterium HGW-Firmicutes-1]
MNNWIDRYVYAVCEKLPKKHRESIEKEIRSSVSYAINNKRLQNEDSYIMSDDDVFEVFLELGSPTKMAEKYYPNYKYLIGPDLFELYILLLFVVTFSVCFAIGITTLVSVICAQDAFHTLIVKLPMQLISAILISIGSVTLIFALIQYFNHENRFNIKAIKMKWHPKDMRVVPPIKNRLRRRETIIALCFTTLVIIIFNLFPRRIAIYTFSGDISTIMPIFDLGVLKYYMKYVNIFWFVQILVYVYHLKTRQWTIFSRVVTIIISLGTLWVILKMVSNPAILNSSLNNVLLPSNSFPITNFISMFIKGFLAIVMVSTTYEVVRHFYYMIKK